MILKFHNVLSLVLIYISITLISCKAQEQKNYKSCQNTELIKELVEQEFITQKNKFDNVIYNKVLEQTISKENLELFLKSEGFSMMTKIEIKSEKDIIDFTNFFSTKDFEYMRCQLKQNKIDNWKQILERKHFETSNIAENTLSYSVPLFSTDQNHALIYRETVGSGSLFLLKKSNGKWEYLAKQLIWID